MCIGLVLDFSLNVFANIDDSKIWIMKSNNFCPSKVQSCSSGGSAYFDYFGSNYHIYSANCAFHIFQTSLI